MRNYLKLDYIIYKAATQTEIRELQGVEYKIIYEKVWLKRDKNEEVSFDQAENPLLYKDSEYDNTLKVSVDDGTLIALTPKIKAINIATNEETRVYKDSRSGIDVDTREKMEARLIEKIVDAQNVHPTPPPNQVSRPDINSFTIDLGPSLADGSVEERKPLGERGL